jgi:hypothetical protein
VFLSRTAKRLKAWGLQAKSKPYAESEQLPRAFDTNKMIACQFFNRIGRADLAIFITLLIFKTSTIFKICKARSVKAGTETGQTLFISQTKYRNLSRDPARNFIRNTRSHAENAKNFAQNARSDQLVRRL